MYIGYHAVVVTNFLIRDLERAAHRKYGGRASFEARQAACAGKKEAKQAAKADGAAGVARELKERWAPLKVRIIDQGRCNKHHRWRNIIRLMILFVWQHPSSPRLKAANRPAPRPTRLPF